MRSTSSTCFQRYCKNNFLKNKIISAYTLKKDGAHGAGGAGNILKTLQIGHFQYFVTNTITNYDKVCWSPCISQSKVNPTHCLRDSPSILVLMGLEPPNISLILVNN
jgi:hypothetical protein